MSAQQIMETKYGLPDLKYQEKYCVLWYIKADFPWFPADHILINVDFKAMMTEALTNIQQQGLAHEIISFDGCYNDRYVRGSTSALSMHYWAAAFDMNAFKEKRGQKTTNWSEAFLKCMTDAGIFWGGNFKTIVDPMHFAEYDG